MILKSASFVLSAAAGCLVFAASAGATELKVTLFGQQCLLQGPVAVDEGTLQAIHAISPEQVIPEVSFNDSGGDGSLQLGKSLQKLRSQKPLPPSLDRYREALGRRLEAQVAFAEGLAASRTARKAAPLLTGTKKHLLKTKSGARATLLKSFESLAKKLEAADPKSEPRDLGDQLFESYSELIEPDPEEEFHRAIRRLSVRYACSYEEEEPSVESGD